MHPLRIYLDYFKPNDDPNCEPWYQDMVWTAFLHITAATRVPHGYSSISGILTPDRGGQSDQEESFWIAETLKYLFLIFDDPQRISLDEWVFNTEAHPL